MPIPSKKFVMTPLDPIIIIQAYALMNGGDTSTKIARVEMRVFPLIKNRVVKKASGIPIRQAPSVPATPTKSVFFKPFR